jgi:aldose 1-epimerase
MRNEAELALGPGYRATGVTSFNDGGPYAEGPQFGREKETAHSFIGWDGAAVIETPSSALSIHVEASGSLRCPVVWAPPHADFLCLEPQSHGIGAPSERRAREATPMARLEPGETLSGWMRISASALT